jgi:hypothetical protein
MRLKRHYQNLKMRYGENLFIGISQKDIFLNYNKRNP